MRKSHNITKRKFKGPILFAVLVVSTVILGAFSAGIYSKIHKKSQVLVDTQQPSNSLTPTTKPTPKIQTVDPVKVAPSSTPNNSQPSHTSTNSPAPATAVIPYNCSGDETLLAREKQSLRNVYYEDVKYVTYGNIPSDNVASMNDYINKENINIQQTYKAQLETLKFGQSKGCILNFLQPPLLPPYVPGSAWQYIPYNP